MSSSAFARAEQIARAVLYEGYMLYPYRASSTKNRRRITFGTLYPEHHPDVLQGVERCRNTTQCLVRGTLASVLACRVRFLQLQFRELEAEPEGGLPEPPQSEGALGEDAIERALETELELRELLEAPRTMSFEFPASVAVSNHRDACGNATASIHNTQSALSGRICISAETAEHPGVFRLTVELMNSTPCTFGTDASAALLSSLVSAHTVVGVKDGEFISLLDPPQELRHAAATCRNVGLYPVLVGEPGERDLMLASPIILYDYPQVAPESAGDLFDSTEMDEMLTLRIMTLTDEEKSEMRNSGDRVRELLERVEATAREQLRRTHSAIRDLRPAKDDAA